MPVHDLARNIQIARVPSTHPPLFEVSFCRMGAYLAVTLDGIATGARGNDDTVQEED